MRTIVYIDGFNLYYGCLKDTPYKWLDVKTLFQKLLEEKHEIVEIKYFTARVKASPKKANSPQKQQAYINALKAYIPNISIHYGHFLTHKVRMANANPPPNTLEVIKTEEKGSDVNLAVEMLNDAWLNQFDCAVVVSNDSDMASSMRLIREHHKSKKIGLVTPGQKTRTSEQLKKHSHFVRKIRNSLLEDSQLPGKIPNSTLHKPSEWE